MVQVQNEPGTYGSVRDFGAAAQKLFDGPVPAVAGQGARRAAGQLEPGVRQGCGRVLPCLVRGAFHRRGGGGGQEGICAADVRERRAARSVPPGCARRHTPAAAPPTTSSLSTRPRRPAIDIVAPDIYMQGVAQGRSRHRAVQGRAVRCWCPRSATIRCSRATSTMCSGAQALGIVPFGIDYTGYSNYPLGAKNIDEAIEAFARPYRLLAPMARDWARLSFEKRVWGAGEPDDHGQPQARPRPLDRHAGFNEWQFGMKEWFGDHEGQARVVGLAFGRRVVSPARPRRIPAHRPACARVFRAGGRPQGERPDFRQRRRGQLRRWQVVAHRASGMATRPTTD